MVTYQGRIVNVAGCNKATYVNEEFKGLYSATINGRPPVQFNQGDYAKAVDSTVWFPNSVKVDICGNLIIAEKRNSRIRKVTKGKHENIVGLDYGISEKSNFYNTGYIYTIAGNQDTLGFRNFGAPVAEGILNVGASISTERGYRYKTTAPENDGCEVNCDIRGNDNNQSRYVDFESDGSTLVDKDIYFQVGPPVNHVYIMSRNRVLPPSQYDVIQNVKTGRDTSFCKRDSDYFLYPNWEKGQTQIGSIDRYQSKCLPGFQNAVSPLDVQNSIISAIALSIAIVSALYFPPAVPPLAAALALTLILIGEQITCRKKTNQTNEKIDGLEVKVVSAGGNIYNIDTYGDSMMMKILGGVRAANQYSRDVGVTKKVRDIYFGDENTPKKPSGFAGTIWSINRSPEPAGEWKITEPSFDFPKERIGGTYNDERVAVNVRKFKDERKYENEYKFTQYYNSKHVWTDGPSLRLLYGYYYCDYVTDRNQECIDYKNGKRVRKSEITDPPAVFTCGGSMSEADRFLQRAGFFKQEEEDVDMADAFLKGGEKTPAAELTDEDVYFPLTDRNAYFSELGQAVAQIEYEIQTRDSNTYKQSPLYNNQTSLESYIDSLTSMYRTKTNVNYPGTKEEVRGERIEAPPPQESSTSVAPAVATVDINSLLNPVRYKFINQGDSLNFPKELRIAKLFIGDRNSPRPETGTAMAIEKILKGVKITDKQINQCSIRDLEVSPPPTIQIEGSDIKISCEGATKDKFKNDLNTFKTNTGEDYFDFKMRMSSREALQPTQAINRAITYGAETSTVPNIKSILVNSDGELLVITQDNDGNSSIKRIRYNPRTRSNNGEFADADSILNINEVEKSYWKYRCEDVTVGSELLPPFALSNNGDVLDVDDQDLTQVSLGSISDITRCPVTGNYYVCDPENGVVFAIVKGDDGRYYTKIVAGKIGGSNRRAGDGGLSYNPVVSCESEEEYYYSGSRLSNPTGIVVDSKGNAIIADTGHRVIRVVMNENVSCLQPANTRYYNLTNLLEFNIYTLAGCGKEVDGSYERVDGMSALNARFTRPEAVALDLSENLYVSDTEKCGNGYIYKIVKETGVIEVFLGKRVVAVSGQIGGSSVCGTPTIEDYVNYNKTPLERRDCYISGVVDITFDLSDNMFILQNTKKIDNGIELQGYNVLFVPKTDITGTLYGIREMRTDLVYIIAGNGASGSYNPVNNYDCKYAIDANLVNPTSIQVDSDRNVYICDADANQVKIVNTNGIIFNAVEEEVDATVEVRESKLFSEYPRDPVKLEILNKNSPIKKLVFDNYDSLHALYDSKKLSVAYKNSTGNFEIEYNLPSRSTVPGIYTAVAVDSDAEYVYLAYQVNDTEHRIIKRYNDYNGNFITLSSNARFNRNIRSLALRENENSVVIDIFVLLDDYSIHRISNFNTPTEGRQVLIAPSTTRRIYCISFINNILYYGGQGGIRTVNIELTNQTTGVDFLNMLDSRFVYDMAYHENQMLYFATGKAIEAIVLERKEDVRVILDVSGTGIPIQTLSFDSYYNLYYNVRNDIYRKERTPYIDYKLNKPLGIVLNADEDLYVTDSENFRIVKLNYSKKAEKRFNDLVIPRFISLNQHLISRNYFVPVASRPATTTSFENEYYTITEESNVFSTSTNHLPTSLEFNTSGNILYSDYLRGSIVLNRTTVLGDNPSQSLTVEKTLTTNTLPIFQGITSFILNGNNVQYILDHKNSTLYEVERTTNTVIKAILGGYTTSLSSTPPPLKLNLPWAVVKDTVNNQLYISDTFNFRIVRYDIATKRSYNLIDTNQLYYPTGLAIINNILYIVDTGSKSVKKLKLNSLNSYTNSDLETVTDKLSVPISVAVHQNGTIYVGDIGLKKVVSIDSVCNKITVIAGNGTNTGSTTYGVGTAIVSPISLKVRGDSLYILDSFSSKIYKLRTSSSPIIANSELETLFKLRTFTTGAYTYAFPCDTDSEGSIIHQQLPVGISGVDQPAFFRLTYEQSHSGSSDINRLISNQVRTDGSWIASIPLFGNPYDLERDNANNYYISDAYPVTDRGNGSITTYDMISQIISRSEEPFKKRSLHDINERVRAAGGFGDYIIGKYLCYDKVTNRLYFSNGSYIKYINPYLNRSASGDSTSSNIKHSEPIRAGSTTRVVGYKDYYNVSTLISGTNGYSVDGADAVNAQTRDIQSLAVDKYGNLYIADTGNNAIRMICVNEGRKYFGRNMLAGNIYTLIGGNTPNATGTFDGDGLAITKPDGTKNDAVKLNRPSGIVIDSGMNLYIADSDNHRVRMVNGGTSIIETIVGDGTPAANILIRDDGSSDTVRGVEAKLNKPGKLLLDKDGNLLIHDYFGGLESLDQTRGQSVLRRLKSRLNDSRTVSGNKNILTLTNPTNLIDFNSKLYIKDDAGLHTLDYFSRIKDDSAFSDILDLRVYNNTSLIYTRGKKIFKYNICSSTSEEIAQTPESTNDIKLFTYNNESNIYYIDSSNFLKSLNIIGGNSSPGPQLSNPSSIIFVKTSENQKWLFVGTSSGPYSKILKFNPDSIGTSLAAFGGINAPSVLSLASPVKNVRTVTIGKNETVQWEEPPTGGVDGNFKYKITIWNKNGEYSLTHSKDNLETTRTPQLWIKKENFNFVPFAYRIDYTFTPISAGTAAATAINFYGTPVWSDGSTNISNLRGVTLPPPTYNRDELSSDTKNIANISLHNIKGLAFYNNHLYVSDEGNNCIYKVNMSGIYDIIAGKRLTTNSTTPARVPEDGKLATEVLLNKPTRLTVDPFGNVFFINSETSTVHMIKNGYIYTICGDTIRHKSINDIINGIAISTIGKRYISTGYIYDTAEGTFNIYYDNINSRNHKTGEYVPASHKSNQFFYINDGMRVDIRDGLSMIDQKTDNNDVVSTSAMLRTPEYLETLTYSNSDNYRYTQVNLGVYYEKNGIRYDLIYQPISDYNDEGIMRLDLPLSPRNCYFLKLSNEDINVYIDRFIPRFIDTPPSPPNIFPTNPTDTIFSVDGLDDSIILSELQGSSDNKAYLTTAAIENIPSNLVLYYTEYVKELPQPPDISDYLTPTVIDSFNIRFTWKTDTNYDYFYSLNDRDYIAVTLIDRRTVGTTDEQSSTITRLTPNTPYTVYLKRQTKTTPYIRTNAAVYTQVRTPPLPPPPPAPAPEPAPAARVDEITAPDISSFTTPEPLSWDRIVIKWNLDSDDSLGNKYTYAIKINDGPFIDIIEPITVNNIGSLTASYTITQLRADITYIIRLIRIRNGIDSPEVTYSAIGARTVERLPALRLNDISASDRTSTSIKISWSNTAALPSSLPINTPLFYYVTISNSSGLEISIQLVNGDIIGPDRNGISSYFITVARHFRFETGIEYSFRIRQTTTVDAASDFTRSDISIFSNIVTGSLLTGAAPPTVDAILKTTPYILTHIYFRVAPPYALTDFPNPSEFILTTYTSRGPSGTINDITNKPTSGYSQDNDETNFGFRVKEGSITATNIYIYYHVNKNTSSNIEKFMIRNPANSAYGYLSGYSTADGNFGTVVGQVRNSTNSYNFIGKISLLYYNPLQRIILPSNFQTNILNPPTTWSTPANSIFVGIWNILGGLSINPATAAPTTTGGMIGGQIKTYNVYKEYNSDPAIYFIVDSDTNMRYDISYTIIDNGSLVWNAISEPTIEGTVQIYNETRENLLEAATSIEEFNREVRAIETHLESNNLLEDELKKSVYETIFVKLPNEDYTEEVVEEEKEEVVDANTAPSKPIFSPIRVVNNWVDNNHTVTVQWSSPEANRTTVIELKRNGFFVNYPPSSSNLIGSSGNATYIFPLMRDNKIDSYNIYVTMANSYGSSLNSARFQISGKK
jgi:hypothetical protein